MPCGADCASTGLQILIFGLTAGAVTALSAVGFSLAYSVSRQLNLAHGGVFALTTVVVASLGRMLGLTTADPPAARLAALALLVLAGAGVGAGLNWGVERLAFRPFSARRDPLAPLMASVALSFLLLGAAVRWHAWTHVPGAGHHGVNLPMLALPDLLPKVDWWIGGALVTLKDLLVLLSATVAAGALAMLLGRSRTGRLLRASAEDPEMAALCGADPREAQRLAFALGGALVGIGAAIFAAYYGGTAAQYGPGSGLAAITAAVLGGIGNPAGALAGGVLLGVFAAISDYLLDARWTPVLVLALLVVLLACRPAGLLARGLDEQPQPAAMLGAGRAGPGARRLLMGLLLLGLSYPLLDSLAGWNRLPSATTALLLVIQAVGLGIVVAMAGLLDLGYAAFFAVGSYAAALATASGSRLGPALPGLLREPWLALPLAGLAAALVGLAFGLPSLRTRGQYLAVVTLALGELVPAVILRLPDLTGGPRGVSGIPAIRFGPWPDGSPLHAYGLALAVAALGGLAALRLADSRIGRAWAAVRDDELAAAAVGVRPATARLLAFGIGAAYAGLAGALWASLGGYVDPDQFGLTISLMVLAAVVLGAQYGVAGAVLGALTMALYDRLLIEAATAATRAIGAATGLEWLRLADLRGDNFLIFGLALYLAVRLRAARSV